MIKKQLRELSDKNTIKTTILDKIKVKRAPLRIRHAPL